MINISKSARLLLLAFTAAVLAACGSVGGGNLATAPDNASAASAAAPDYLIGPLDKLEILVRASGRPHFDAAG
jgi:hypothetical protein